MGFIADITPWIDEDFLVGNCLNPSKWSGGNQLLETSIAAVFCKKLDPSEEFISSVSSAFDRCRKASVLFDKNPGRPDQITHDDLLGIATASKICGMPWADYIADFGSSHSWVMSNTGKLYWDAVAKPQERAVYKYCSNKDACFIERLSLLTAYSLIATHGDPSSQRLYWLASTALKGSRFGLDATIAAWNQKMNDRYTDVGGMMIAYYNNPNHPFVVHGKNWKFGD